MAEEQQQQGPVLAAIVFGKGPPILVTIIFVDGGTDNRLQRIDAVDDE